MKLGEMCGCREPPAPWVTSGTVKGFGEPCSILFLCFLKLSSKPLLIAGAETEWTWGCCVRGPCAVLLCAAVLPALGFPLHGISSVGAVTWGESKAGKQRGHFLPKTVCKRRGNAMGAGLKESM